MRLRPRDPNPPASGAFPGHLDPAQRRLVDVLVAAYLTEGRPVTCHYVASNAGEDTAGALDVLRSLPTLGSWAPRTYGYGFFSWTRYSPWAQPKDVSLDEKLRPTVAALLASPQGAELAGQVLQVIAALASTASAHKATRMGEPDYARFTQAEAAQVIGGNTLVPGQEFIELVQAEPIVHLWTYLQGSRDDGWHLEVRPEAARLAYAADPNGYLDGLASAVDAHNSQARDETPTVASTAPQPWSRQVLGWVHKTARQLLAEVQSQVLKALAGAIAAGIIAGAWLLLR